MGSELGNIEDSLYWRVFSIMSQRKWYSSQTFTLQQVDGATYGVPNGKPWVFLDAQMQTRTDGVVVSVGSDVIPPDRYTVNYLDAQVTFDTEPGDVVTVTADTYAAGVVRGYPEDEFLQKAQLPLIAVTVDRVEGHGAAIGTSEQDRTRFCQIDLLADTKTTLRDLFDDLYRFVAYVPLMQLEEKQPLDSLGNVDPNFSFADQFIEMMRQTTKPRGGPIPPRSGGLDKERLRALITFQVSRVS